MFVVRQNNRGRRLAVWAVTLVLAWLAAPVSYAQTGALPLDSYLHGSGGTTNPPTLTLDLLPSISLTAKTKDSSALNFSGGNPWQVLGSWIPPSGSSGAFTITAVGPTHVWTGLKASGDVGGKIDLLTEVLVNGSVISSGLTRCVSNLTASASTPVDVSVALGTIPVTPINPATQTLAVRVSARMGTTATNTACGTKTSVTGVRLYFDALTRLSRVNVTFQTPPSSPVALIPNPFNIKAGATANLTAILFPVPLQATSLTVTSTSPAVATVPATVPVAAGQLFVSVPVTGVSAGAIQVRVTLNGKSAYSTVKVTGGVATVTSLTPPSLSITQGGTGTLTVTLNAVQSTNQTVSLTSSATSIASVPASVSVPAGQLSAPVAVAANTAGQADITATLNGSSATSHITVTPTLPTVVAVQPAMSQVVLGASSTLTVTISSAQVSSTTVTLAASPSGILTLPTTVLVPANQTQATFSVTGLALGTAMVTASLNSSNATAAVDVIPPALQLTALQPPTQSIVAGATGSLTVSINALQTTPTDIALTVDNPVLLTIPPTVTVQPNQLTATFTVIGKATGLATITATLGTITKTATVTVTPQPPQVTALLPATLSVIQGATGSLTLSINAAQVSDTTVPLTTSSATILDVPASVIVPSGLTSVTIPVTGLTLGTATVTATLNGTVTSTITVVPPPALVTALGPAPLTLAKGRVGILQVTISRVPTVPTVVTLTNAHTSLVTIPAIVTVQAGQLTAEFPVTTQHEGMASITASLNGSSQSAQVMVVAAEADQVTVAPSNPTVFAGDSLAFTATAIMTDGSTQPLTSGLTWTSTNLAVATISSTGFASALTVGTATIRAAATNSLGPVTGETTLTVQPTPTLTLAPASATLAVNSTLTLTVTSSMPAPVGGLTVSFGLSGTGTLTLNPLTVLIPQGSTSGQLQVTATNPGVMTVTATAPQRTPGTSTITIPGPIITNVAPLTGPIGTSVTITGQNFDLIASNNTVKFNGKPAIILAASATSITTTVPQGATNGPITVSTSVATGAGPAFTVQIRDDFTLSAAPASPATATVVQGGQTSYALTVTAPSGSTFAGLVALSLNALPAGVTGQFSAQNLTIGQTGYLTIRTTGGVTAGTIPISVMGTATVEGGVRTQSIPLVLQVVAAGGQTVLSGEVLRTDGTPISNVLLKIIGTSLESRTNAAGQFLFPNAPAGAQQLMVNANEAVAGYPIYHMDLILTAGQVSTFPTIWITPPPPAERFTLLNNATAAQVITDSRFPGAEITIPAGVTIVGWDGALKTKLAIERLSPDKLPVPPPPGPTKSVFQIFFGTPMGGQPSAPIPVTLPNDLDLDPGNQAELWYYDASPLGGPGAWKLAGMGTVSSDGKKIISDPGVGIQRFCGVCGLPCFINRQATQPNTNPNGTKGGDPVDLATGVFVVEKTDLVLAGRSPVVLSRTYNPFDPFGTISGFQPALGPGWYLSTDVILLPGITFFGGPSNLVRLILPGNTRLDMQRQANGTFSNDSHPLLKGAVLTVRSTGTSFDVSELRFRDGSVWLFNRKFLGGLATVFDFLVEMKDRNGNRTIIERNGTGQISRIIDSAGREITFSYAGSQIAEIHDPIGRTVRYGYTNGRLSTVTDLNGGVTQYSYDTAGRILSITDARGISYITNVYSPGSGRILRQTQADGSVWNFRYKFTGATVSGPDCPASAPPGTGIAITLPLRCPTEESIQAVQAGYSFVGGSVTSTTLIDPRGNATVHQFNGTGFLTEAINPLGQVTKLAYNGSNQVTALTDALGRTNRVTYDAVGNITTLTDPNSQMTRFEYEPTFNRVTKITDALNQDTIFTYDLKGNLLTSTDPLNHTTTIAYNAVGQPLSVTDAVGNVTTFEYDAAGNLMSTTDPRGSRTVRLYDAVSRLIQLTDAKGFATQFSYDPLNRATQITDAMNGLTAFSYDPNGNLLTVTDAEAHTTTYTYDNMDRLKTRKDALPTHPAESYDYDPAGNLTRFVDRKGQQATFQYDPLNRRTQSVYADSTATFTYDAAGRLTKADDTALGAGTIEFSYDTLDRLIQEITGQGTVAYQYDVLDRQIQMVANGQQPTTYQYDSASRLTRVVQGSLFAALGYDNAGRRTNLGYSNGTTTSYAYDLASRLTGITYTGPGASVLDALTYTYDAVGNRLSQTRANGTASLVPSAVASATYDAANEQTQFAGAVLQYDANGNLTNDGTNTYVWDARNRLGTISGGVTATFSYDALGRRTSKVVNGVASQFLYDGNDIISEVGSGSIRVSYLRSLSIDEPFIRQSSIGAEFYHMDALGSTLVISNQSGTSGATYSYEPFGRGIMTGTTMNPIQFTGRESDAAGLFHYRERYYDSRLHRFISQDPIRSRGGDFNFYAYVGNNPVNWRDPKGLIKIKGVGDAPIYVRQPGGDPDPFPSDPHGHIGSPDSPLKVDVNTGKIYHKATPTGDSLSAKDLRILRDVLKKAGYLGLALELFDLLMAKDLLAALGNIDPLSIIGGNLSGDDMLPLPTVPNGPVKGSKSNQ